LGCIISEFLTKKPIFFGNKEHEQIIEMLKVLGKPTEEELAELDKLGLFIPDYLDQLKVTEAIGLQQKLSLAKDDPLFDLIRLENILLNFARKMLKFVPNDRITAKNALDHKLFEAM
jgi:serine/threonine protein kinase